MLSKLTGRRHWTARLLGVALVLALALGGPLAAPLEALLSDSTELCPRHGRSCTCPDHCMREERGRHEGWDKPAPPSCHRVPASENSEPQPKPECTMSGCGHAELGVIAGADTLYFPGNEAAPLRPPAPAVAAAFQPPAPAPFADASPPPPPPRA